MDETLKQTSSFASEISHFIGSFVSPQTPAEGTKKESEGAMREHLHTVMYHSTSFRNLL